MKKIAFVDFGSKFNPEEFFILDYIKDSVDYEITEMKDADYVIYSILGNEHWFAPDHSIKIFYTIENLAPDFNACDYAIGFEWMQFEDRYMRFPLYYWYPRINELMENKHHLSIEKIKQKKARFCDITVSNTNRAPIYKELFDALSKYKPVDSGGAWNNNIGEKVKDKLAFNEMHKFSIVCENSAHSGYTTEKIVEAFAANCIPIYWGDPSVARVFNPKAFINVSDFSSVEEVVEYVKKVDMDDELYESMLREPVLADSCYSKANQSALMKEFLLSIFSQPLPCARRRNRIVSGELYINERRKQVRSLSFRLNEKYHQTVWQTKVRLRRVYWFLKTFIRK